MLVYLFIYEYLIDSYILQNYLHGGFCQRVQIFRRRILFLTFVVLNFRFVGIESLIKLMALFTYL